MDGDAVVVVALLLLLLVLIPLLLMLLFLSVSLPGTLIYSFSLACDLLYSTLKFGTSHLMCVWRKSHQVVLRTEYEQMIRDTLNCS